MKASAPGSLVPPLGGSIIFDTAADAATPEGGASSPAPEPESTEEPEPSPIGPPSEFDPEELRGLPPDDVRARIPADRVRKPSKSGGDDVYVDPDHYARQVRITPGYPPGSRPDPTTWGPYAQISQNGQKVKIPLAGNPTLEGS